MNSKQVEIWTDGSCNFKNKNGGFGVVILYKDQKFEYFEGHKDTTNNRMELSAVLYAINSITKKCTCRIYSDSQYVVKGINIFMHNWSLKNFTDVKNDDLWKQIKTALDNTKAKIEVVWIKGHDKTHRYPYNEQADELARQGYLQVGGKN